MVDDQSDFSQDAVPVLGSDGVRLCFGCRVNDRCQNGLRDERLTNNDAGFARFVFVCPDERQGMPGVAHGGWVAAVFDEALGRSLTLAGHFAVTRSLAVRYRRPVPAAVPLLVLVRRGVSEGNRCDLEGELTLESGALLATAQATFVFREGDAHLERFRDWLSSTGHSEAGT